MWGSARPTERREQHEDRIDVGGQPRDLVAVERSFQRVAVRSRPDGLHHVSEVEATGDEGLVAK
jgi:hypothetical protein